MSTKERIKIFDDDTAIIFHNKYEAWQFSMHIKTARRYVEKYLHTKEKWSGSRRDEME